MKTVLLLILLIAAIESFAQNPKSEEVKIEDLKLQILKLNEDVETIQFNLVRSQSKFKRGIFVATLGYCVTIAGGLMLGRENDDLGKVLLITGGATGFTGTILMADAFKYLGKAGRGRGTRK